MNSRFHTGRTRGELNDDNRDQIYYVQLEVFSLGIAICGKLINNIHCSSLDKPTENDRLAVLDVSVRNGMS